MKKISAAAAAAFTVLLAAGCGSAATLATRDPSPAIRPAVQEKAAAKQPADPRPVFLEAGASYDSYDGTAVARDFYGDKYLCGVLKQESVCVYSFATAARQQEDLTQPGSGDGEVTVKGPGWDVWVIPVTDAEGNFTFPVSPAVIAERVHGTVVR